MSTNYPTSIDSLTNPTATDSVATVSHSSQHANANDAIEALEAKVGADGSAVTTSHDYKLSEVISTDKAVGKTATQTLTNKTLTSPTINAATITGVVTDSSTRTVSGAVDAGGAPSFELPNSATPTVDANGEIALDTSVADFSHGVFKYYGGEEMAMIAVPIAELTSPTNGDVVTYNATSDEFELVQPNVGGAIVSILPLPLFGLYTVGSEGGMSATVAFVGAVMIPVKIVVNKISFNVAAHTTNGTMRVGVFSEDGQTKHIDVVTASITTTGVVTTAVSAVTLNPGVYYVAAVGDGTVNISLSTFIPSTDSNITWANNGVSSEPIYSGTVATSGGNLPSTITPASISVATTKEQIIFRLDN